MRRSLFAASLLLSAALSLPVCALASGNVLLPKNDDDGTSPYANLGLSAAPPPAASAQPAPAPAPAPAAGSSQPTDVQPAYSAPEAPPPSQPAVFGGGAASTLSSNTSTAGTGMATVKTPQGVLQIINEPDLSQSMDQAAQQLPHHIGIGISGNSIFGSGDVQNLTSTLGITREQIPTACILTVRGLLTTDKGGYMIEGRPSPRTMVHYDGVIQNYAMNATAVCSLNGAPTGTGVVIQTGNRYQVRLSPITCPVPRQQVHELSITYTGTSTPKCDYR